MTASFVDVGFRAFELSIWTRIRQVLNNTSYGDARSSMSQSLRRSRLSDGVWRLARKVEVGFLVNCVGMSLYTVISVVIVILSPSSRCPQLKVPFTLEPTPRLRWTNERDRTRMWVEKVIGPVKKRGKASNVLRGCKKDRSDPHLRPRVNLDPRLCVSLMRESSDLVKSFNLSF